MSDKVANLKNDQDSKSNLGFWIYLMTDLVLFASFFAVFAVLRGNTFGGASGRELFDLEFVLAETMILLASSFACGIAMIHARQGSRNRTVFWLLLTFILGAIFLGLEISEFSHLVSEGDSWRRSGFLSGYFSLVGLHGLHITAGLIWLAVLFGLIFKRGLIKSTVGRLGLFSVFWHFLDIVWIFIFTVVYLFGAVT